MRISDWSSDVCSSDLVILSAIEEEVDITLVELAEMLRSEHGAVFAPSTIWRFLDRHSMTIKKKQRTPASRSGPTFARGGAQGSRPSLVPPPKGQCSSLKHTRQQSGHHRRAGEREA